MSITILSGPRTSALTTLARVKGLLGITETELDVALQRDIDEASSLIALECSREFGLAKVREGQQGDDATTMILRRRPVLNVSELLEDSTVVPVDQYSLDDAEAGILFRERGFIRAASDVDGITRDPGPMRSRERYRATYRGGFRLAPDNVSASGLPLTPGSNSIALPTGDPRAPWPLLDPGETVSFTGFGEAGNLGAKTVLSRTDLVLTFVEDLTAETGPAEAEIRTMTAPPALERLCLDTIKTWFLERRRSLNVTSESIGDWSASYGTADYSGVLPAKVADQVRRLFGSFV